jgi:hypothetical protein
MKRTLLSVILISSVAATAIAADPFLSVGAHGQASYTALAYTTHYTAGSSNSYDIYGDTPFYAGGGDNGNIYENWDYYLGSYYVGDDEWGNPIYQDQYETQTEYAEVSANAYARFDRSLGQIGGEVYGYGYANSWSSGSVASASAQASAASVLDIAFTLSTNTAVKISRDTYYGDGNLTLYLDGNFFIDSANIPGSYLTVLPAGNYTISGSAYSGGANLNIESVPEPTTLAALGLGALAVLRRRRKA